MRIALICTGLGRVVRGFESFSESLFHSMRRFASHMDVTLFQGGGKPGERRFVVPNFHRNDRPARWFDSHRANMLEQRSFALSLYPLLRYGGYDVVHYNELAMGSALFHLRRYFGGHYRLLYCSGSTWSPAHYHHRCDFVQILSGPMYEQAQQFGISDQRLFLIPYGVDEEGFSPKVKLQRSQTRRELGIPEGARVIMTVAMLDREIKRIDFLIKELSKLDSPVWLLAAGQRTEDTPFLEDMANHLLQGRWRFVSWPYERVPSLYGAADVFVLTSLAEGFGLVSVEAMLCGLPVILHNGPVFRWVAQGTSARLIDMSAEGELARNLEEEWWMKDISLSGADGAKRFSWKELIPSYVEMYHAVAGNRKSNGKTMRAC